jgi:two-component system, NarL family, invasion response regulator UvrY
MESSLPIPVAIVDDHTLFREGLARVVNEMDGYQVLLEAEHGEAYIHASKNVAPIAIALVDLHMPVMDGYRTLEWIRAETPGTRALALTFEKEDDAMARALRSGACGFLQKDIGVRALRSALDQIAATGWYDEERTQQVLRQHDAEQNDHTREYHQVKEHVSERELEFLELVCDRNELTYEQIAGRMGVGRRTVDGYREALFAKFGMKSKCGLLLFALRTQLVKL